MGPLAEITKLVLKYRTEHSGTFDQMLESSAKLRDACRNVQRSWSGSFAG